MPYTAFVVNLTSAKGICKIVYGCTSTAFTKLGGNSNAFISKFAMPLKSLGLKKKGNIWTMSDGGHIFDIEKSQLFGDKYYFNLNGCRIQIPKYPEPVDWQLVDEDSLEKFIQCVVEEIQNMTIY